YKYRPRRKPKSLIKKDRYAFPIPCLPSAMDHLSSIPRTFVPGSSAALSSLASSLEAQKGKGFLPPTSLASHAAAASFYSHFDTAAFSKLSAESAAALSKF